MDAGILKGEGRERTKANLCLIMVKQAPKGAYPHTQGCRDEKNKNIATHNSMNRYIISAKFKSYGPLISDSD